MPERVPIILDTDIGVDIDDTWALALLLRSAELEPKLVVSVAGDAVYRARLAARFLQEAGREDVPVGVGLSRPDPDEPQRPWVEGYELSDYPGLVHADGVGAIVDTIMGADEPITLIAIGRLTNVAAALHRQPAIAARARFVGMLGSVFAGYNGQAPAIVEANVRCDIPAARAVFAAPWLRATITPLDSCGRVRLAGAHYRQVRESRHPVCVSLMENYRLWMGRRPSWAGCPADLAEHSSTTLFDTVAVHLAHTRRYLEMRALSLAVTPEGRTAVDEAGRPFEVATGWTDLEGFHAELAGRIAGGVL